MDIITILSGLFTILAIILFIIFLIVLYKRFEKTNENLFYEHSENIEDLPDKIRDVKSNKRFFKKKQNPFKNFLFVLKDFMRDLSRFGKKREQKLNILYLDEMGSLHFTTGYMLHENIEFEIGGLKILKGINLGIKEKLYVGEKVYNYFFIPHIYYENMSLRLTISENFKLKLDFIERDRERIVDNDITKTFMDMDDTQAAMFRTGLISSFLGGFGSAIFLVVILIGIFMMM
jgi:hypothetical protein